MAYEVDEQSTAFLTVQLYDKDDVLAQPASATYEIHDVQSGEEIRAATVISIAGGEVEIKLTKADNTFVNGATGGREIRRVTIKSVYTSADRLNAEFFYELVGLEQVS